MFKIKNNYIYRQCVNESSLLKDLLENNLDTFFQNKAFQEMLLVANPKFFKLLTKEKIYKNSTFRNYVKRSITRATPFGLFSSVGVGSFSGVQDLRQNTNKYRKIVSIDGKWISSVCTMLENQNTTLLKLTLQWNQKVLDISDRYELTNVNYWGLSKTSRDICIKKTKLLEFIKKQTHRSEVSVSELVLMIQNKSPNLETQKILDYLHKLITSDFLFTNLRTVVRDDKFLDNLLDIISTIDEQNLLFYKLSQIKLHIDKYSIMEIGDGVLQYMNICKEMSDIFNDEEEQYLKIDLLSNYIKVMIPQDLIETLEEVINFISRVNLTRSYRNKELASYTEKFVEKYGEYVEIPLKQLLSTHTGLGFPNLTLENSPTLLSDTEKQFLSYLSKEVFKSIKNNSCEVDISDIPSELLFPDFGQLKSNQLELYCEIKNIEDQSIISIVPNTGSDMIGKSIGRFASYFSNSRIDLDSSVENVELIEFPNDSKNLNVMSLNNSHPKKLLLSYENDFSISSLDLEYLVVGVTRIEEQYKLYFRDLRTKSIVNFVTTSMLNHKSTRIFSPLARFLLSASVEWQDNPFTIFRLIENFDDFPYVPRIKYKNIVFTDEKWVLHRENRTSISSINQWRKDFDVPRLLYYHKNDERILVDLENSLDVEWLLKQNVDRIFFTRFQNIEGNSCEFIFGFENFQTNPNQDIKEKSVRIISDNLYDEYVKTFSSDWFYCKLYGVRLSSMSDLRDSLLIFIDKLRDTDLISDFHFVNYNDNGETSLRLRFKVVRDVNSEKLRYQIIRWTDFLLSFGFCKDVSFNLYEREIERYGGIKSIEICERMFSADSYLTLKLFSQKNLRVDDYLSVLHSIFLYIKILGVSLGELSILMNKNLTKNSYRKNFKRLFPNNSKVVAEFKSYFDSKNNFNVLEEILGRFPVYELPIHELSNQDYINMVYSLLHMHMNRLGTLSWNEKKYLYFVRYIVEVLNDYEKYNKKVR